MSNKNFLQDVIPPAQKRSIRNIPVPKHHHHESPEDYEDENETDSIHPQPRVHRKNPRLDFDAPQRSSKKFFVTILAIIAVIFLIIANVFTSADVVITARTEQVSIDSTFPIVNSTTAQNDTSGLLYQTVEVSRELSETLKAGEEKEVNEKASGKIIVYNNFSEKSQPLVKRTRFESEKGNIYRIQENISVPGMSDGTPGSIEVVVYADETGDEFNAGITTFTIPGFKGLPQFDDFTAKSKTEITGGFSGIRKIVSESDRSVAMEKLQAELKNQLIEAAEKDLPENFILTHSSDDFQFDSKEEPVSKSKISFKVKGTLSVKIFNVNSLGNTLATEYVPAFNTTDNVILKNPNALNYNFDTENDTVEINGAGVIQWIINTELLKNKLAGTDKSELPSILRDFSAIDKAEINIQPFWKKVFPESPDSINILEEETLE